MKKHKFLRVQNFFLLVPKCCWLYLFSVYKVMDHSRTWYSRWANTKCEVFVLFYSDYIVCHFGKVKLEPKSGAGLSKVVYKGGNI